MSDPLVPSLGRARELKISELSTHFANDDLTLEDLERRIERVYKAANLADLDAITADLTPSAAAVAAVPAPIRRSVASRLSATAPAPHDPEHGRILALMSSTRRVGRWAVPRSLDIVAVMSDTKIDMTNALIPPGIVDIDVTVVMAAFRLVVPPNVRVVNQVHAVMADVRSKADELLPGDALVTADSPVIRLKGIAFMAEVKVVVRRREDARFADDDDED